MTVGLATVAAAASAAAAATAIEAMAAVANGQCGHRTSIPKRPHARWNGKPTNNPTMVASTF